MKTLYESILDDEDEVMDRMGKDIIQKKKQDIISFIQDNYMLYSNKGRFLKISKYVKVSDDWVVDIKDSIISDGYTLMVNYNKEPGIFPVKDFTWGKTCKINIRFTDANTIFPDTLPKECVGLEIWGLDKIQNVDISKIKITEEIRIYDSKSVKTIILNPNQDLKILYLADMQKLTSVKGIPGGISYRLDIINCPSLKSFGSTMTNYLNCSNCPKLHTGNIIDWSKINK